MLDFILPPKRIQQVDFCMNLQNPILKASKETEAYRQKLCIDGDADVIERFKARGMEITYPDLDLFIQKVQPVYIEFADRLGGMDKIKAVQAVK